MKLPHDRHDEPRNGHSAAIRKEDHERYTARVRPEIQPRWADHDPEAITALHSEDSVFHLHDISPAATGRAAIRNLIMVLLAAVPDVRFQPVRVHFGRDHFVSEYVMSGTIQGHAFAIEGADIFTMREGLVARKDSYVDWVAYSRQTGLEPVDPMSS
jgi:ketosteroid isomerase-like protein